MAKNQGKKYKQEFFVTVMEAHTTDEGTVTWDGIDDSDDSWTGSVPSSVGIVVGRQLKFTVEET